MKIGIILLVLCFAFHLQAQHVISGTARDSDTHQLLPHCVITLLHREKGAIADDYGKFKIEVNTGDQLAFSYVGYETDTLRIDDQKPEYEILLKSIPSALDEVVVTAVTRTGLIKENPISITNVTAKMIERSNENNIIDVLAKNTPGMNTLKTGPNISKPFIRGMGFNRVLTLYDGVRQEGQQWGGEHGLEIDNYNIERAEVIKGPASLVYGSDALAGVVSLLPFVPKENDGILKGRWLSEYQSNNGLIGNGFRISQGYKHWLWVARGSYRKAKNYSNAVDGRVFNTGFQEKNISTLIGYKSHGGYSHFNLSLYDNLQGIPDGSRDSLTRAFTKQIYEGSQDDIKNRPVVSNSELNSYELSPLHQRIQHYRAYLNNHYEIGNGDISMLIAFTQNIRREFNHPTVTDQAGTYLRLNTVNYSVRYNAPEIAHMEASFGFNGMFQNNKNKDATNFPVPNYDLTDFGAFGVAKWKKESWTIIGGVRTDARNIRTYDFYSRTDANGFDRQVFNADTIGATQQFSSINQSFHGISLSLGSTYQINEVLNVKFNFSRGYRAPSISEIAANGLDVGAHILYIGNPHFVSEFSWQEDFGLFANFSEVSASVSLFNKNIENFIYLNQVTDTQGKPLTDAQGNKTFQYQQATAQLYGLEGTFSWKPKNIYGFSFNNQLALCYGFNRNSLFENKRQQGEYLPFIPPARWVSNLSQEFELKSSWLSSVNISAEMDFNAKQNRFLELYNTETLTPGYALLNLAAGATIHQSQRTNWQFQLQVNNVMDAVYQSNMSRLKYFEYYQQSPNGRSGIYSMGRNLCAKIIFSF